MSGRAERWPDEATEGLFGQQLQLLRKADVKNLFPDQMANWAHYGSEGKLAEVLGVTPSGITARKRGTTALNERDQVLLAEHFRLLAVGLDARVFDEPDIAAFEQALERHRYFRFEEAAWLERIEIAIQAAQPGRRKAKNAPLEWRDGDEVALVEAGRARDAGETPLARDLVPVARPPEYAIGTVLQVRVALNPQRPVKVLAGVLNPCLSFRLLPGSATALRLPHGHIDNTLPLGAELTPDAPCGRHHLLVFVFPGNDIQPLLTLDRRYGPAATAVDLAALHTLVTDPDSRLMEVRRLVFDIVPARKGRGGG